MSPARPSDPQIAIFVDVQNIYYTTRDVYQRQFNYRALWQRISAQGRITHAIAYAIDRGDDQQRKFQDALRHIGFQVKLKPYISRRDGSAKGDWDVGITLDVVDIAPLVDTVILLSGDGDFDLLAQQVQNIKKKKKNNSNNNNKVSVEVYGVPGLTAKSLVDQATFYHKIEEDLLL